MIWQNAHWLYLLLLIPTLHLLAMWQSGRTRRNRAGLFSDRLLDSLRPGFAPLGMRFRDGLTLGALTMLILGLAGPKLGTEVREIEQKGVDLLIALDLSRSMNVADIRPSRLEKAKFEISRLIDQSEGNRIGLLVFTGEAFVQSPLTLDHPALRMFLDVADTRQMPSTSTDFRAAFVRARQAFQTLQQDSEESGMNLSGGSTADARTLRADDATDVLLLISDGEDHGEPFEDALKQLTDDGVLVFTTGIGSLTGAPIPVFEEGTDRVIGYHRGPEGRVVNSQLEREVLQQIAALGDGEYYEIGNSGGSLDPFLGKLEELKTGTFSSQEFVDFKNQYQWLVGAGLLLLTVSLLIPNARPNRAVAGHGS